MANIGNGKATRIGANGEGAGNKTLGTVKGRKLGLEKVSLTCKL